jgi:hypothetical protein
VRRNFCPKLSDPLQLVLVRSRKGRRSIKRRDRRGTDSRLNVCHDVADVFCFGFMRGGFVFLILGKEWALRVAISR